MSDINLFEECVSRTRTFQRSQYEPETIFASRKISFSSDGFEDSKSMRKWAKKERDQAFKDLNQELQEQEEYLKSLGKVPDHHRITTIETIRYPHVTNIITPETPPIPDIQLHADVGTALDWSCKKYIDEGILIYNEENGLEGKWLEMYVDCLLKMKETLKKNPIQFSTHSLKCVNKEYVYCGELDAIGEWEGLPAVIDFKKTNKPAKAIRDKYFMQMSAYGMCLDVKPEALIIITPFQEPIVSKDVDDYFELFLEKRRVYKERFKV